MQRFVDIHDSLESPPRVLLCSLEDGTILVSIYEQPAPTPHTGRFQLVPPEILTIIASDGTELHGAVYKPDAAQFGQPPYRAVVSVYGGPNVQTVCNSWMNTVDMRAQYLRSRGILVWKVSILFFLEVGDLGQMGTSCILTAQLIQKGPVNRI
jgi:dipeptidyl-peptidase-4